MSDKARHALSQGLLWTSSDEAACGVTLHPTRYLIAGNSYYLIHGRLKQHESLDAWRILYSRDFFQILWSLTKSSAYVCFIHYTVLTIIKNDLNPGLIF